MKLRRSLAAWLEARSGVPGGLQRFFGKPLPPNVGWLHTLGSLVLLYIATQFLSGVLLALYYNPSPENAYPSVRYVRDELAAGRFIHQLHHHGAGFVLAAAALHMLRSFLLAAYKKPRELLWMSGVALLGLLFLFAFTGYLLPFHQNGYWATVVGLNLMADAPLVGGAARDLLTGGSPDLGAVALSRFFLLHVCLLPLGLGALLFFHLRVLQKTGSAGSVRGDVPLHLHAPFYPGQAFKDMLACAGGVLLLSLVAWFVPAEQYPPASTTPGGFAPRPEWYFLPHFELLKLTPSGWQRLATFWLPAVIGGLVFFLPLWDRNPERRPERRRGLIGAGLSGVAAVLFFGWLGTRRAAPAPPPAAERDAQQDPVARGRELFFGDKECYSCHVVGGEGIEYGPNLSHVARKVKDEFFEPFLRDPTSHAPLTDMPPFNGTEAELQAVIAFLRSLQ